ncbi:ADP-ribose pyrophosphatase [Liquorilactobacillus aquaticus DSM 21051]|uniref:ADP-ribose pyrophosphatase n=1 Tax=Liquorilactobacillus aquaticus DSM 21051 TaxID=1423725 RepID=A0A0R2CXA1_9LACO|nr:NUDIX hydrolase [Liquorilactobacillus aquaticus]KRM96526.1 ADP-ribose pyrophosphatase [Liquorilactobacillus aquaticus DSM 21051]
MKFEEKALETKHVFKGKVIDLDVETVILPDGKKATREIVHHHGAVGIVCITENEKIILVKQWRQPLRKATLEIPAGKIDPEEKGPLNTAARELNEEVRLSAQSFEYITSFYTSPGFADEKMFLYRAHGLNSVEKNLPRDAGEFLNIFELSMEQVEEEIKKGTICDSKTLMAIWYWKMNRIKE